MHHPFDRIQPAKQPTARTTRRSLFGILFGGLGALLALAGTAKAQQPYGLRRPGRGTVTTFALGEESSRPPVTTYALGEESSATTRALYEESGRPPVTTYALGEESSATTRALYEESGRPPVTTYAFGEESAQRPTTLALYEEG